MNLRHNITATALGMRNQLTIPIDIDLTNRINIAGSSLTNIQNCQNVTQASVQCYQQQTQQVQQQSAIAAAACHLATFTQPSHYHSLAHHGQTVQLHNSNNSQLHRNYHSGIHEPNGTSHRTRYPFPFIGYTPYRRY